MKKPILIAIAIFFTSLLANAQVKSDYAKDTDFSKYKTYTFSGWQANTDKQLNDIDKKRITDALKADFADRGLTLTTDSVNADAKIGIYVVLDAKTSTTAYTDYMGGMGYGPRWGWGMGAGGGMATTNYVQDDYTVGTLVVDMYDAATKALVWQGVISKTVNENPQKREKTIPKSIDKLMMSYPVAATAK